MGLAPDKKMDLMKMTRLEVASASRFFAKAFPDREKLHQAKILDELIARQLPDSSHKERPTIANDLARQLGAPNPGAVAVRLMMYYRSMETKIASGATDDDDGDGIELKRKHPKSRDE